MQNIIKRIWLGCQRFYFSLLFYTYIFKKSKNVWQYFLKLHDAFLTLKWAGFNPGDGVDPLLYEVDLYEDLKTLPYEELVWNPDLFLWGYTDRDPKEQLTTYFGYKYATMGYKKRRKTRTRFYNAFDLRGVDFTQAHFQQETIDLHTQEPFAFYRQTFAFSPVSSVSIASDNGKIKLKALLHFLFFNTDVQFDKWALRGTALLYFLGRLRHKNFIYVKHFYVALLKKRGLKGKLVQNFFGSRERHLWANKYYTAQNNFVPSIMLKDASYLMKTRMHHQYYYYLYNHAITHSLHASTFGIEDSLYGKYSLLASTELHESDNLIFPMAPAALLTQITEGPSYDAYGLYPVLPEMPLYSVIRPNKLIDPRHLTMALAKVPLAFNSPTRFLIDALGRRIRTFTKEQSIRVKYLRRSQRNYRFVRRLTNRSLKHDERVNSFNFLGDIRGLNSGFIWKKGVFLKTNNMSRRTSESDSRSDSERLSSLGIYDEYAFTTGLTDFPKLFHILYFGAMYVGGDSMPDGFDDEEEDEDDEAGDEDDEEDGAEVDDGDDEEEDGEDPEEDEKFCRDWEMPLLETSMRMLILLYHHILERSIATNSSPNDTILDYDMQDEAVEYDLLPRRLAIDTTETMGPIILDQLYAFASSVFTLHKSFVYMGFPQPTVKIGRWLGVVEYFYGNFRYTLFFPVAVVAWIIFFVLAILVGFFDFAEVYAYSQFFEPAALFLWITGFSFLTYPIIAIFFQKRDLVDTVTTTSSVVSSLLLGFIVGRYWPYLTAAHSSVANPSAIISRIYPLTTAMPVPGSITYRGIDSNIFQHTHHYPLMTLETDMVDDFRFRSSLRLKPRDIPGFLIRSRKHDGFLGRWKGQTQKNPRTWWRWRFKKLKRLISFEPPVDLDFHFWYFFNRGRGVEIEPRAYLFRSPANRADVFWNVVQQRPIQKTGSASFFRTSFEPVPLPIRVAETELKKGPRRPIPKHDYTFRKHHNFTKVYYGRAANKFYNHYTNFSDIWQQVFGRKGNRRRFKRFIKKRMTKDPRLVRLTRKEMMDEVSPEWHIPTSLERFSFKLQSSSAKLMLASFPVTSTKERSFVFGKRSFLQQVFLGIRRGGSTETAWLLFSHGPWGENVRHIQFEYEPPPAPGREHTQRTSRLEVHRGGKERFGYLDELVYARDLNLDFRDAALFPYSLQTLVFRDPSRRLSQNGSTAFFLRHTTKTVTFIRHQRRVGVHKKTRGRAFRDNHLWKTNYRPFPISNSYRTRSKLRKSNRQAIHNYRPIPRVGQYEATRTIYPFEKMKVRGVQWATLPDGFREVRSLNYNARNYMNLRGASQNKKSFASTLVGEFYDIYMRILTILNLTPYQKNHFWAITTSPRNTHYRGSAPLEPTIVLHHTDVKPLEFRASDQFFVTQQPTTRSIKRVTSLRFLLRYHTPYQRKIKFIGIFKHSRHDWRPLAAPKVSWLPTQWSGPMLALDCRFITQLPVNELDDYTSRVITKADDVVTRIRPYGPFKRHIGHYRNLYQRLDHSKQEVGYVADNYFQVGARLSYETGSRRRWNEDIAAFEPEANNAVYDLETPFQEYTLPSLPERFAKSRKRVRGRHMFQYMELKNFRVARLDHSLTGKFIKDDPGYFLNANQEKYQRNLHFYEQRLFRKWPTQTAFHFNTDYVVWGTLSFTRYDPANSVVMRAAQDYNGAPGAFHLGYRLFFRVAANVNAITHTALYIRVTGALVSFLSSTAMLMFSLPDPWPIFTLF